MNWEDVEQRLKMAIAELPLPYRTVFLLWAVEELKYREIAEIIELPVGTVMSRLHRARTQLASRVADLGAECGFVRGRRESLG
jgi:RNA polymerase sigma-70 factor (ECF subfamily)